MDRRRARKMPLEVAVFSVESALAAQNLGASRVELNAPGSYAVGGLTPTLEQLEQLRSEPRRLTIPVRVMIRPRGAPAGGLDFVYSARELADMLAAIARFKASGLMSPVDGDGFVFGALTEADAGDEGVPGGSRVEIDERICTALVEAATPFGCVFHRAFDPIAAGGRGLDGAEQLIKLGFQGLLTAGGLNGGCCDQDHVDRIDVMCRRTAGKIQVIAGGGLRRYNIRRPAAQLAVYDDSSIWFHTACVKAVDGVPTEQLDSDELVDVLAVLELVQPA